MTGVDNIVPPALRGTSTVIADQLRERILDGSFAPGEQISEVQLAARLKMSRGPVREAVQRLAQEGLLVSHRNRGVFVIELDASDIEDVYRGRRAVEKEAACTVYERGIPPGLVARMAGTRPKTPPTRTVSSSVVARTRASMPTAEADSPDGRT